MPVQFSNGEIFLVTILFQPFVNQSDIQMASENWFGFQMVGPFENQTLKSPAFSWLAFEWFKALQSWNVLK
jgi:hypothetical protein